MTHSRKAFWLTFLGGVLVLLCFTVPPMIAGHITAEAPVSRR